MTQSVTPRALALNERTPEFPSSTTLDSGATQSSDQRVKLAWKDADLDEYHQTLAALHKRRRDLLRLKRLGQAEYNEDELLELRAYIDGFQDVIVALEENRHRSLVGKFEAVASDLLSELRG